MAPILYLVWGVLALGFAAAAWWPGRRLGPLVPVYFFGGWLAGELALQFIALHAAVTLGFALAGALSSGTGVVGLALTLAACGMLLANHLRAIAAREEVAALAGASDLAIDLAVSPHHGLVAPFRMVRPGVQRISDVAYGPSLPGDKGKRNLLDIVLPRESGSDRPALLQIHGGGWIIGEKEQQAGPLMNHLAERGWVCFAMNYRLSPRARFPDHIVDVKRAIAWFREHAREYGADPNFLAVTGGSAGGHLSALTALSANDPAFQPGFEEADTRVDAAVPFYGVFDFRDRLGVRGKQSMEPFVAKRVFQCTPEQNPELWDAMTPVARVHAEAPPFLVVHGTHDSLAYVEDAREFVRALKEKSSEPVHYLEFEGGQHAFDVFHSVRCAHAVRAVAAFLDSVHSDYRDNRS
jgi:acetyl esterase/lipase